MLSRDHNILWLPESNGYPTYFNYVLVVNVSGDGLGQRKARVRGRPKRIPPENTPLAGCAVLPAAPKVDRLSPLW